MSLNNSFLFCFFVFGFLDFNGIVLGTEGPVSGSFEEIKPDGSHPAIVGYVLFMDNHLSNGLLDAFKLLGCLID